MFEDVSEAATSSALRTLTPPRPVWVRVALLLPTPPPRWNRETSISKRSGGLDTGEIVRGDLLAWVVDSCGCWSAVVRMTLHSSNGRLRLDLPRQLVPPDAVIPIEPGQQSMTHVLFDKTLQRRILARTRGRA
jgi:hypothetical protein